MGSPAIDEASVLARFDELVKEGTVLYSPDLRKVHHTDGGFKFEFRLTSALKSKPAAVGGNSELDDDGGGGGKDQSSAQSQDRDNSHPRRDHGIALDADGCIPGGDISVAGFVVDAVNDGTHVLVFNKFCAYRPHLMLLAADGRRRQFEALGRADFAAAARVLGALGEGYLAIYNCGKGGGCSRLHKHMQIFPAPEEFGLWPDGEGGNDADADADVPFRYFLRRFGGDGGVPGVEALRGWYREMLVEAARLVPGREDVVEEDEDGHGVAVPHNVVLGRRWMLVVPRTRAGVDGADANAAGMLGMVWASGEETLEKWMALGPRWVLGEVGVRV